MTDCPRFTRRQIMQGGVGAAALVASAPLLAARLTPAQTEGPFFPKKDQADKDLDLTRVAGRSGSAKGEVVEINGQVLDDTGAPVAGALVDVWQANSLGRYDHEADTNPAALDPDFQGWARLTTDAEGRFHVRTIKPGAYPVSDSWSRPPHIHFKVARRGYREIATQMYFAGDPLNALDRIWDSLSVEDRASVTVAFVAADGAAPTGRFEMVIRKV